MNKLLSLFVILLYWSALIIIPAGVGYYLSDNQADRAAWATAITSLVITTIIGLLTKEDK